MMWLEFLICAALIIWAGSLLSKYGDVIAEKTGLGRAWIGAILIAGVTTLVTPPILRSLFAQKKHEASPEIEDTMAGANLKDEEAD
jgi:Ca2+/Na+ antiporter